MAQVLSSVVSPPLVCDISAGRGCPPEGHRGVGSSAEPLRVEPREISGRTLPLGQPWLIPRSLQFPPPGTVFPQTSA